MIEGLWIVRFQGPQGGGGGVALFSGGKVFGGDSGFTYVGTYQLKGESFAAKVSVANFDPAIPNVIGVVGNFDLLLEGKIQGDSITATGALAVAPDARIVVRLAKHCNLT